MKRGLTLILLGISSFLGLAQMSQDDEVTYQSAVDWLDQKLNYVYYDDVSGKWWKNTFYINEEKEVTIKHISSDKPNTARIQDKGYTIRTFNLVDINPYKLKLTKAEDTKGRIVKGTILELRTTASKKTIHKTINNRRGSSTSFLSLSFPEFLNDSLANYADIAKAKFAEAIITSTKVYSESREKDMFKIISVLSGTFTSESSKIWNASKIFPNVLKVNLDNDSENYFGYDSKNDQFYLTLISNESISTSYYRILDDNKFILSEINGSSTIAIENTNSFIWDGDSYFKN